MEYPVMLLLNVVLLGSFGVSRCSNTGFPKFRQIAILIKFVLYS